VDEFVAFAQRKTWGSQDNGGNGILLSHSTSFGDTSKPLGRSTTAGGQSMFKSTPAWMDDIDVYQVHLLTHALQIARFQALTDLIIVDNGALKACLRWFRLYSSTCLASADWIC
jgi:hypothetical protein